MNRNQLNMWGLMCVAIGLTLLGAEAMQQPNVVLIVCDDLNDYITGIPGETGHPQTITPNMEKLAKSGVAFRRAYSNNPVCAPSRASFLTGIYPHTSGNLFWAKWFKNPILKNSKTIMEHFSDNGYRVAGTGKLMHHHFADAWQGGEFKNKADYGPFWFNGEERWSHPSVPEPFAGIGPVDGSFAPLGPVPEGQPANAGWKHGWGKERLLDFTGGNDRDLTPDELNAKWAVGKLQQFAGQKGEKPFFLSVGFIRPHTPLHVPQEYFDRFPEDELQLPVIKEGDNEDVGFTAELFPESKGLKYFQLLKESYPGKLEGLKAFTRAYLASVAAVDDCIGQVVDALDASGLKDNTIVVVTSDHGWSMGEKDYLFKNALWEESTRIPFVVRAPGVARPGGVAEHPISLIDLYPTLVDLCGLKGDTRKNNEGASLDGHSVRPFLENPESGTWAGPDGALTMIFAGGKATPQYNTDITMQHWSLRSERFRYIRYNNGVEELYDHEHDPHEWTNLADSPEHAAVKKELNEKLNAMIVPKSSAPMATPAVTPPAKTAQKKWDWFGALDANQDGKVNEDEWLTWSEKAQARKGKPYNEEQFRGYFGKRDANGDGFIARAELVE